MGQFSSWPILKNQAHPKRASLLARVWNPDLWSENGPPWLFPRRKYEIGMLIMSSQPSLSAPLEDQTAVRLGPLMKGPDLASPQFPFSRDQLDRKSRCIFHVNDKDKVKIFLKEMEWAHLRIRISQGLGIEEVQMGPRRLLDKPYLHPQPWKCKWPMAI